MGRGNTTRPTRTNAYAWQAGQGAVLEGLLLVEQKQPGRGCYCCRDFLLVSRETGGYYAALSKNIEKFFNDLQFVHNFIIFA